MANDRPWRRFYPSQAKALDDQGFGLIKSADELIRESADAFGDKPAVTTALPNGWSASLSYREVDQYSQAFANYLRSIGLKSGEVVGLQSLNCAGFAIAILGILRANLAVTNINPLYTPYEMRHQLRDSGAKALVYMDLLGKTVEDAVTDQPDLHLVSMSLSDFFAPVRRTVLDVSLKRRAKKVPQTALNPVPLKKALKTGANSSSGTWQEGSSEQPALYQYSGGTTGKSKGVMLNFEKVIGNHMQVRSMLEETVGPPQTTLLVLPVYHMFGLTTLIYSLRVGGHTVMAPDPRPVEKLRKAFETFKPDWVPGVNTLLAHLLEEDWMKSSSNRVATTITGGTALTRRVAENWQATTGASIVEAYGLTEATAAVTITIPGMAERDGSVGIPLPLTEVAILRDDNTFADTGEAGEIIVRGPQTMAGYLGSQELTDNAMYNDWLHTGDMGYQDEDGFVFLVDRKKDMINVSGFNVFPAEIEDCLADHPGVLEACVVGVPDDQTGEGVVAHIVRRRQNLTKEAVLEHCKERLTNYKRPRHIEFVDSLPKTPVGKILRREVRKQATQSHSTA